MRLADILKRLNVSPENIVQIEELAGDGADTDLNYVPRERLNKVIKQRDALRAQHDDDDDDDDDVPPKSKKNPGAKQETPEEIAARIQAEVDAKVALVEKRFAVLSNLRESGFIDPELALTQIDLTKVSPKDGKYEGLDEQVTALKTAKPFLLSERPPEDTTPPAGTGKGGTGRSKELPEDKMSDEEYIAKQLSGGK